MQVNLKPLKMVMAITDRNKAKKLVTLLNENGFDFHDAFLGTGTAPTEFAAYFGLHEPEKVILISCLTQERTDEALSLFKKEEFFKEHGGMAFTVPVNSISNMNVFHLLTGIEIAKN